MLKFFVGLILAGLVSYIVYHRLNAVPLDARQTIDAGVQQVMQTAKLDPEQQQLLRVQLSISDHIASKGVPPESLESLVPRYFDQVPRDPRTNEPYEYVRDKNSYRLGSQVSGQPVQVASAGKSEPGAEPLEPELEFGDLDNFINPNTMEMADFVYNPEGKRNPFRPFDFSDKTIVDSSAPPLQRYALGQLKVTAILTSGSRGATAFVEDQTGIGYPVRVGTKIGNQHGVVISIEKDRVNVVEKAVDFTGTEEKRHIIMKLQPTADAKRR